MKQINAFCYRILYLVYDIIRFEEKNWHYAIRSFGISNIELTIIEFNVPYFDDSFIFFVIL